MLMINQWRGGLLVASGLVLLAAGASRASDTPTTIILPGPTEIADESAFPQAPAIPFLTTEETDADELIIREAPVVDPRDKGSVFTDGAHDAPNSVLTAGEQAKLQMARAAVAAAMANGTLPMQVNEDLGPALTEEEITAAKDRLRVEHRPVEIVSDPAAGVGVEIPAVQHSGPHDLNEIERAKLEGSPLPVVPVTPEPAPETRKEVQ